MKDNDKKKAREIFRKNLSRIMSVRGVNQADIVTRLGVSSATASDWVNGIKYPRVDAMQALAEMLDVEMSTLMSDKLSEVPVATNIIPLPAFRSIPLLGDIACGDPITADENVNGYIPLPDYVHADFCLTCKGDSMINARIYDGDIVFIRHQPTVEDGEIAAVRIGSEATLKRVKKYSKMIVLKPENPAYPDIELNGNDEIEIIGKAVHFLSAVK